ncbi:DUF3987 domain-containing protein [Vibrio parahaemolyticus]|uniref:DUF3987 domain-containing protein n=1 Tax=Vibrio parahaemolyticus TaxID=670 RepID=UPI0004237BCA|nr:DUF3987 domain-containing protein [Vibrio parahaemolyticus]EIF8962031.1 DUF3987 domain-containing protein [Vibrio parahaemolyticus]
MLMKFFNKKSSKIKENNTFKSNLQSVEEKSKKKVASNNRKLIDDTDQIIKVKPSLDKKGCYGFIGNVMKLLSKGTEAIPEFMGAELISFISICIERENVYVPYRTSKTVPRCNSLLVAHTGAGKGLSSQLLSCIRSSDKNKSLFACIHEGGLSTPEGLINVIKDDTEDENGNLIKGVKDKRLFIVEEEFVNVINQGKKGNSTLSSTIRCLFDGKGVEPLTKFNRIGCKKPHVGIYAHITPEELLAKLDSNDLNNGFLNRFAIFFGTKQPDTPFATPIRDEIINELSDSFGDIIQWCNKEQKQFTYSEEYVDLWNKQYSRLRSLGSQGTLEQALLVRAPHYATMYAMIFAATDKTTLLTKAHLEASLAWIDYWCQSVRYIYSTELEEIQSEKRKELAREVFKGLKILIERNNGHPIGKSPITKHFSGRFSASEIADALKYMQELPESPIKVTLLPRNKHEIQLI